MIYRWNEKLAITINKNQRGYIKPGATLVSHSTYNKNTKYDSNETLVFATDYDSEDEFVKAGKRFYGENQWPENMPELKPAVQEFMSEIEQLGKKLLPIWALALGLDTDYFKPYFHKPHNYLRLAHYPPVPDLGDNEFGLGPHADTGFMTFLPQADVEGLEVLLTDGSWIRPPKMDDAILVNTGQFLERWTNEKFRASPHRVIPPKNRHRFSIAAFINPSFEPVCHPIESCVSDENPSKYPSQSYWDFYNWYMVNTYPHYEEFDAPKEASSS
jgi:isopenicillin N synthase-like dioxygenase